MQRLRYPQALTVAQVDNYHGTPVEDPYRWLEDTGSAETREWIASQNQLTFGFLEKIPQRQQIRQRLTELWDYPKAWAPLRKGKHYFQLRNSGLQNQDALYVLDSLDGEGRLLLDPNTLSNDGTVALSGWAVSEDGRYLAYATSASGSDWLTWRVRDVERVLDLPDLIEWSKFSPAAWIKNSDSEDEQAISPFAAGFFYARYDQPGEGEEFQSVNYYHKVYFHRLSSFQSEDILVYERPDQKEWGFAPLVSDDGRYLILTVWAGTDVRNRLFYKDLLCTEPFVELVSELEASYEFVGNDGAIFYISTNLDAPRKRLVAVDIRQPEKTLWRTLIPQRADVLEAVKIINGQFVAIYLHDAHHMISLFGLDGMPLGEVVLPTIGTIIHDMENWGFNGGRSDPDLFYAFQSFACPTTIYRYDFASNSSQVLFSPSIQFDFSPYLTRQVFVASQDGTQVPMFLVHRRDLPAGPQPALLYGYGGFAISITPSFQVSRLAWLEMGGVLAVANLRGGGEYGEEWHQAGMLDRKQNVFDDFIACAEYLVAKGITTSSKLAIQGGSNGGLLVGACMTQRPELFAAALPAVGVMDMLRFHQFTIGWAWTSDYGCADNPDQFTFLYAYSPLHNLKPGTHYPATLVTTADHDDRVVPGHSFKFIATLQAAQGGPAPVLIRIQTRAGHGFGKPTAILIEEATDIWSFLVEVLGLNQ